jgi:hypothetical protein
MRRPSVFALLTVALLLVGVAMAVTAAIDGAVPLVLGGAGFAVLAGVAHLGDRRSQATRRALEQRLQRGFEAVGQDLTQVVSRQELADVLERLDRLDVRLDESQRRLVASIDAARLEDAERAARATA